MTDEQVIIIVIVIVIIIDEQVAGAKKQLLSDVYTLMEDPLQLVENMGAQVRHESPVSFIEKILGIKVSLDIVTISLNHLKSAVLDMV